MLFSDLPRSHYEKAPLHEVICQLRFPTILSINQEEPAAFQEKIRGDFPQYARREDRLPPKLLPGENGGAPKLQVPPATANYNFLSEDGRWKLNLTQDFIALSTLHYDSWEEFARLLDKALAAFIEIYKPAFFQRVGLRYMNIISRSRLGLKDSLWTELISPAYTGPMQEPDVREESFRGCNCEFLFQPDSSTLAKVHAGPAQIKVQGRQQQDPEVKFVLDLDLSMAEKVSCTLAAPALETLHGHADRLFEGAISEELREAMRGE